MFDYETYDFSELPGTADGIAAFLQSNGYKGKRVNPFACPMSRYLTANVSRPSEEYCEWTITAWLAAESWAPGEDDIALPLHPEAVSDFISRFDGGAYPGLVER